VVSATAPLALTAGNMTIDLSAYATLASPTFTGNPKAPTPATADNTTSIATTAFVKAQGYATGSFLPLTGGTLTGTLTISAAAPILNLTKAAAGQANAIFGRTGANARWALNLGDTLAEGGSNAGSNFTIARYDDNGTLIETDLTIGRNTGNATFARALNVSGLLAPGGGIAGVADGSNAAAGNVGEFKSAQLVQASAVNIANSTATPIFSLGSAGATLTAGDWDVDGYVGFSGAAATAVQYISAGLATTSGAVPQADNASSIFEPLYGNTPFNFISYIKYALPTLRVNVTASQDVFLNVFVGFTPGSVGAFGFIRARRVR
jgi:hypothetical protein